MWVKFIYNLRALAVPYGTCKYTVAPAHTTRSLLRASNMPGVGKSPKEEDEMTSPGGSSRTEKEASTEDGLCGAQSPPFGRGKKKGFGLGSFYGARRT